MTLLSAELVRAALALAENDSETRELASCWSGTVELVADDQRWQIRVADARLTLAAHPTGAAVRVGGADTAWRLLLGAPAAPGYVDFGETARTDRDFTVSPPPADAVLHMLLRRLSELLRHAAHGSDPAPRLIASPVPPGTHEQRVGRYVHLDLDGVDTSVYYESAGTGVPVLCQHTAGADGRQWRHLLEDERVLSRFQVIAYDLPLHGKSTPPESSAWWAQEYLLTTQSAMAVPLALSDALGLDRPVFLGSSIGGMLGLDLARWHPDRFRAIIALEAALKVSADEAAATLRAGRYVDSALYASQMWGAMSPTAPEVYRHETRLHYTQGAPGVFCGDSYYYLTDHDLVGEADRIDTTRCPVWLLTGEYDYVTVPLTRLAGERITGAQVEIMTGLGHFPMSEDHEQLMTYLLPIFDKIAS